MCCLIKNKNGGNMKIALVCPASLPASQFGGILFLTVDIAKELAKLGHDITIYTTDLDFANNPKTFNKKLPHIESLHGFKINRTHVWFSIKLFFVNPCIYFQIKRDLPQVIHAIGVRSFQAFIAALISKKLNIPLVISDQGGLTTHPDLKQNSFYRILYWTQEALIKFVIKQATKISVANEYEKKIFAQYNAEKKTVIVRNGIDLDSLKQQNLNFKERFGINENFILFVGRFSKVKGIDILLQAWNMVVNNTKSINHKLVIMGVDFGFQSEMMKMIEDLQLKQHVVVIKNPKREEVISAYQFCEFLVLPSRWELSPLTHLEGFAFKKTVISTKSHGIPYTVENGKNAILVDLENPKQLADAILDLISNDKQRIAYGEAGFRLVHDVCNSKEMAMNTLKIYEEVIK